MGQGEGSPKGAVEITRRFCWRSTPHVGPTRPERAHQSDEGLGAWPREAGTCHQCGELSTVPASRAPVKDAEGSSGAWPGLGQARESEPSH